MGAERIRVNYRQSETPTFIQIHNFRSVIFSFAVVDVDEWELYSARHENISVFYLWRGIHARFQRS